MMMMNYMNGGRFNTVSSDGSDFCSYKETIRMELFTVLQAHTAMADP